MYILLGAVVFVAPQFSDNLGGGSIAKITAALLYVIGACFSLVQTIPILMNANAAADRIVQLEAALRSTVSSEEDEIVAPTSFEKIEMRNIMFSYKDRHSDAAFHIGPMDFTLRSGELVFITGGNGSGKSTFLRVLAGLYLPNSGEIMLDGMRVNKATRDDIASCFPRFFTIIICFSGCTASRSRTRANSAACWPSSAWRTRPALPTASFVRSIFPAVSAGGWR